MPATPLGSYGLGLTKLSTAKPEKWAIFADFIVSSAVQQRRTRSSRWVFWKIWLSTITARLETPLGWYGLGFPDEIVLSS
jgi:hypothetical protein